MVGRYLCPAVQFARLEAPGLEEGMAERAGGVGGYSAG